MTPVPWRPPSPSRCRRCPYNAQPPKAVQHEIRDFTLNLSPNVTIPIIMTSTLTPFWNMRSDVPEMIPWQRNCRNEKHPATRPDIVAQNHAVGGVSFKTVCHWCISPESLQQCRYMVWRRC